MEEVTDECCCCHEYATCPCCMSCGWGPFCDACWDKHRCIIVEAQLEYEAHSDGGNSNVYGEKNETNTVDDV